MKEPSQFFVGSTAQSLACSMVDKPQTGLVDCLNMLLSCFRKRMSDGRKERYYFVRPGEKWNSGETFQTDRLREVYCHIKILKKILGLDYIKSYMVKKLLSKPFYADLERQSVKWHTAVLTLLFKILSLPEFKTKFCKDIDYERWIQLKPRKIPLHSKFVQLCKASADNKPEEFQKLLDGGATWTDQPLERGKNVLMFLMERNQGGNSIG